MYAIIICAIYNVRFFKRPMQDNISMWTMHVNFTKQFSVKQPKLATAFANVDLYPPVKDHMEGNVIHLCLSFIEKNSC